MGILHTLFGGKGMLGPGEGQGGYFCLSCRYLRILKKCRLFGAPVPSSEIRNSLLKKQGSPHGCQDPWEFKGALGLKRQTLGVFKRGWQLKRLKNALALDLGGPTF